MDNKTAKSIYDLFYTPSIWPEGFPIMMVKSNSDAISRVFVLYKPSPTQAIIGVIYRHQANDKADWLGEDRWEFVFGQPRNTEWTMLWFQGQVKIPTPEWDGRMIGKGYHDVAVKRK